MITVATTTIKVERPSTPGGVVRDPYGAGYGTPSDVDLQWTTITTGVRAVIDAATGTSGEPGDTEVAKYKLTCDPTDLAHLDRVTDETTSTVYRVVWTTPLAGIFNLDHVIAGLETIDGMVETIDTEG